MKIRKGDIVRVIAGKYKGKEGKVLQSFVDADHVLVEGVNIVTRHIKKQGSTPGQKTQLEKSIHVSNVSYIDPVSKTPTRIGYTLEKGKKVRVAKKSQTIIK